MLKTLLIASFLLVSLIGCQNDTALNPNDFKSDIPTWLEIKINDISTDQDYYYSKVYRYEWNEKLIYHIMVPISSCAFCELYYHNGKRVHLTTDEFSDFLQNKKNEVLVWEWDHE